MIKGIAYGTLMINHSLKNHVVNIQLLADRLKQKQDSAQQEEELDLIFSESDKLMEMINRIRSQIEDVEMVPELCNLTEILENVVKLNRKIIEAQSVTLELEWEGSPQIWGDKAHLQEFFHNIIRNSIEALQGRNGTIKIRIDEIGRKTKISIADNGVGIDRAHLDKIFDPFFSTKTTSNNYGLGLSYCYIVIQKHKGTIEAISKEGNYLSHCIASKEMVRAH